MDRTELHQLLRSATFHNAQRNMRDLLRHHVFRVLGGDWDQMHNEYGIYTINCRAKGIGRTLAKCDRVENGGTHVSSANFYRAIPDLVALRIVVVDPSDIFRLAEKVRQGCLAPAFCNPDPPLTVARVRHGRFSMYDVNSFGDTGAYEIEVESTGYCSVHFVFRTGESFYSTLCRDEDLSDIRILDRDKIIPMSGWHVEIQVRTIMEEAWGETDHFVRYEDAALREDPEISDQFASLAGYLQAASHHVSLIRRSARRKKGLVK
jgi:putative GTP pyrophosphokinase